MGAAHPGQVLLPRALQPLLDPYLDHVRAFAPGDLHSTALREWDALRTAPAGHVDLGPGGRCPLLAVTLLSLSGRTFPPPPGPCPLPTTSSALQPHGAALTLARHPMLAPARGRAQAPPGPTVVLAAVAVANAAVVEARLAAAPGAWQGALATYLTTVRRLLAVFAGYELRQAGAVVHAAFPDGAAAVRFAMRLQLLLLHQHWPPALLRDGGADAEAHKLGSALLWRGLRASAAIDKCDVTAAEWDPEGQRMRYTGPGVHYVDYLLQHARQGVPRGRSTGRSGRQKAAPRRNMRREDRVTVQGPVKEQQPDGLSHGGFGPAAAEAADAKNRGGCRGRIPRVWCGGSGWYLSGMQRVDAVGPVGVGEGMAAAQGMGVDPCTGRGAMARRCLSSNGTRPPCTPRVAALPSPSPAGECLVHERAHAEVRDRLTTLLADDACRHHLLYTAEAAGLNAHSAGHDVVLTSPVHGPRKADQWHALTPAPLKAREHPDTFVQTAVCTRSRRRDEYYGDDVRACVERYREAPLLTALAAVRSAPPEGRVTFVACSMVEFASRAMLYPARFKYDVQVCAPRAGPPQGLGTAPRCVTALKSQVSGEKSNRSGTRAPGLDWIFWAIYSSNQGPQIGQVLRSMCWGGGFGTGDIWIFEIWHNKIVPNFAMEFKNLCQILPAPNFSILVTKISPTFFCAICLHVTLFCMILMERTVQQVLYVSL